ncbi:hypothetical protein VOLCADRAFT_103570 [Volvox carteri f. nagariensis]|uniref:Meiosis-specific nuclear structural protein 1 n=1 Tax=Volvox carteri f. nagariensis TaxID=3068 RepID=D8TMW1_VOLCA|nr:uncharacterized protein VOLCADRAFT_103570 [Volvox carteri f. nagariensis]EFJ51321.1 hypothetical protein VOLCADRAFT_103570 [Volvox carteri f. nagariensis]|eukprot:XP_002947788.1 hypothetical protein VOLCADRAFT_103570 [Volvox carteri f. nagariensis]
MSACDCTCHNSDVRPPKRGQLAQAVEQREAARRIAEAAKAEISRYFADQKRFDVIANNSVKDDFKRKGREFKERDAEAQMLETVYQNERQKTLSAIRAEEEEKLAVAMARKQQEKERQDKEIQKLREQSEEIRSLAEKVRIARVNKARADQLVEKKVLAEQQQEYDRAINQYVNQAAAEAEVMEAENQAKRREANVRARMMLEEQMAERQEAARLAEQEAARERAMIDEVVKRIMLEDAAETAAKRQRQDETKDFIETFLKQQDELRRKEREAAAAEDRKIAEYWQAVRDREREEAERQAMRKEIADRMYEKVKREMEAEMARRMEEEELINMLRREEAEEKMRLEDEERKRKAEEARAEMVRANAYQMKLKEEREAAFRKEEEDFKQRMLAKFAEDDRLEQLNAQKRRMRLAEHQREVQRLIEEKRKAFEEAKAREEAEDAAKRAEDERLRGLVEEERKKLLREAAELKDFLPRGVMRDQGDVDFIAQAASRVRATDAHALQRRPCHDVHIIFLSREYLPSLQDFAILGRTVIPPNSVTGSSDKKGSSKLGVLYFVTRGQPTNYDMLVFRTLNRDMGLPNHNDDHLAELLRDELMPVRSWVLKHLPFSKIQLKRTLDNPLWGVPGAVNFIDARTKWFDTAVREALASGIKQVVLLAAGYDTRAYRLGRGGVKFFEVDLPSASATKKALVDKLGFIRDPTQRPVYVAADLSRVPLADALSGTGFNPDRPTLFTVEGLIYYLPADACAALFRSLSGLSAPGSRIFFDFMAAAALEGRGKFPGFKVTRKSVANKGEPFLSGIESTREGVATFLSQFGLRLLDFLTPKDMVGRHLPHLPWNERVPPIASFYSYAAAEKPR